MTHPPEPPPDILASEVAAELRGVIGRLKRRLQEETRAGQPGWSQVQVLYRLERDGPSTVSTLARAEGVRPQSMGANIAMLEAAGWVQGAPDPQDRRQTVLSVTPAGQAWIAAGRAARQDWLTHALQARLSREELEMLARAAALLHRLTQP